MSDVTWAIVIVKVSYEGVVASQLNSGNPRGLEKMDTIDWSGLWETFSTMLSEKYLMQQQQKKSLVD